MTNTTPRGPQAASRQALRGDRAANFHALAILVLAAAMLGGCGDDDGPGPGPDAGMMDAGSMEDAGGGGSTGSCESPRAITLAMGANTISGDTTGAASPLTLTECGGEEAAPQDVIALTIPGSASDTYGVRFDFAQDGTAETFDTVTQIRETCDDDASGALCFDDGDDFRSAGQFGAPGGSTRFLIVTGFAPPYEEGNLSEGAYEASVEVFGPLSAPVLTGGSVLNVENAQQRFTLMGSDADMDVVGFEVSFLDASGSVIAIDDDGDETTPPVESFQFGLDGVEGEATFTGTSTVNSEGVTELEDAVTARIALIDAFDLRSATMDIALTAGSFSGLGEACDATNVCTEGLECASDVCAVPADVQAACDAATEMTLSTESSAIVVTVPAGEGLLLGSCGVTLFGPGTTGGEALALVTGMAGHDIVLETTGTNTGENDTVVYALTTCGDPASEVACNDDRPSTDDPPPTDSRLEILDSGATTYTIAVEVLGGVDAATMIDLVGRLRPVLATGAACDPAGVMNRCATAACPTTGEALCP